MSEIPAPGPSSQMPSSLRYIRTLDLLKLSNEEELGQVEEGGGMVKGTV